MKRVIVYDPGVLEIIRDGFVGDNQLRAMELAIMRGDGATVAGTCGLKKIRCAAGHKGKSGSIRILFADYPRVGRTYLLAAFRKDEKDNITMAEGREVGGMKKTLDKVVERMLQNAAQN